MKVSIRHNFNGTITVTVTLDETPDETGGGSSKRAGIGPFDIYLGQRGWAKHGTFYHYDGKINWEINGGEEHYDYLSNILIVKNQSKRCEEYFEEILAKFSYSDMKKIFEAIYSAGITQGKSDKQAEIKQILGL